MNDLRFDNNICSIPSNIIDRCLQAFHDYDQNGLCIEEWTATEKLTLDRISYAADKVGGDINITLYPRHMIQEVWAFEMPGKELNVREYSFRAFARGNNIVIFDDDTETADSLFWVLLHEVAHIWVTRTPNLRKQFRNSSLPKGYLTSDSAHESSPEEQFANMMADRWFFDFTNRRQSFHRLWWRQRVISKLQEQELYDTKSRSQNHSRYIEQSSNKI